MYALVTGAAGFVGSHLSEALVDAGHTVLGVDCFTDYYDPSEKWRNLARLLRSRQFVLAQRDLRDAPLEPLVDGVDVIFHQAGQPGVRRSWADGFSDYCSHNVLATQRLLEAAKNVGCPKFVYASSSSLYGNAETYPTLETALPRPYSPYGVTKLAAEHLCGLYAANWKVSTVALRYFTVYGPRQRPDMAMRRLVDAALHGSAFPLFGTGLQMRDFTYISDVVAANLAAASADLAPGSVLNVAGGSNVTMLDVIGLVGELVGAPVILDQLPGQAGDVDRTGGSTKRAGDMLGWSPEVSLNEGLSSMVTWARALHAPTDITARAS